MLQEEKVVKNSFVLGEGTIQDFKVSLRGQLLQPGDEGYDAARHLWNGMIDKHPALIARCAGAADVIAAVRFARSQNLIVSVKGGGHSFAGTSVCEGGLMIDLSGMKGIRVDQAARTARAEPGVTWGEFDRETASFGLATTGGMISSTGIAGLTVGGGVGWLMRKYGLTCDNLLSVDIVTADGRLLTARATQNEDLFWAVRGGGGNFGIVTSFEYRLHPVNIVLAGPLFYPVSQAKEVLRVYRDFAAAAPDELTTMPSFLLGPPAPFLPPDMQGVPLLAIVCVYCGPIEEGQACIRSLLAACPPRVNLVGPMPYTAVQTMFDQNAKPGMQHYLKSHYLQGLSDECIDTLVTHASQLDSPLSIVHIHQVGGMVSRIDDKETAYGNRAAPYILSIGPGWADPEEAERYANWARQFWSAMQPFSTGGVYVNFIDKDEEAQRVRAAYGPNYERLLSLKQRFDPSNFFELNQNIKPD